MRTYFDGNQLSNNANMKPDHLQRLNNSITPITHQHIGQKDENQNKLFSHINSQNQQNQQNSTNRDSQNDSLFQKNLINNYGQQDYANKSGPSNTLGMIAPSHTHKDQNRNANYFGAQNQVSAPNGKNLPSVPDIFGNRQKQQEESQKPISLWDSSRQQDQKSIFTNRTSSMYDKNQTSWNQKSQPDNNQKPVQGQQNLLFGNGQKQIKPNQDNSLSQNQLQWNQNLTDQQKNLASLQEISNQNKETGQQGLNNYSIQQNQQNVFQQQLNQVPNYNQPNQSFNNTSNYVQQNQQNTQDQWPQQNKLIQLQNNAQFNNLGINQSHNQHQLQISNSDNQTIQENKQKQRQTAKKSGKQENSKQSKAHLEDIVNANEPPMIFKIDIDLPKQQSSFENIAIGPREFVLQNIDVLKGYYQTQKDQILLQDEIEQARIINEQRMRQERELRYKKHNYDPFEHQKCDDSFNHNNYDQRKFRLRKAQQIEQQDDDNLLTNNNYMNSQKALSSNQSFYRPMRQEGYIVDISIMVLESNQQYKLLNFNILANISALEIKQQIIKNLGYYKLFITAKFDEYCKTSQLLSSDGYIYGENDRLNKYSIRQGLLLEVFINPQDVNKAKNLKVTPLLSEIQTYSINELMRIHNLEVQLEDGCRIKWLNQVDFTYVDLDEIIIGSQLYDIQKLGILRIPKFGQRLNTRRLVQQQVPIKVREDFKSEQNMFKNALEAWAIRETQLLGHEFKQFDSTKMVYEYIIDK